jgi:hypothetical protein
MAAHVAVNKSVLKSNRGRSLAMTEYEGNPHLGWERMARLDTPLLLKDKVQAVSRLSRAAMKSREYHLREQLKFTPVPAR